MESPRDSPVTSPHEPVRLAKGSVRVRINDADLSQWRPVAFAMFALAGLGIELIPVLDDHVRMNPGWVLHASAVLLVMVAFAFHRVPAERMQEVGRGVLLVGAAVITVLVACTTPITWLAIFYFWPLLAAAYVYTRYQFAALVLGVLAAYGGALLVNVERFGGEFPLLEYLMFVLGTATVMAAVRLLREGIDELMARLEVISATDALTGLANRRTFEREFALASERAAHHEEPLAVLLFDLDHFKAINDTYGHAQGDAVLRRFADLLAGASRAEDLPARIGGEEFALIMHGTDADEAHAFATRFATVLRDANAALPQGEPPVTVSIGVAELSAHVTGHETLLVEADRALYHAKRTGRDRVVLASEAFETGASPDEDDPGASAGAAR